MPVLVKDSLPDSIAARLGDDQRQAILEAPRGSRLAALGVALGIEENEALAMLAQAAGLDVASNLETDPGARGLLPARLVHDFQIIPIRYDVAPSPDSSDPTPSTPLHLASAWLPDPAMADWLRTFTPRPLVWHLAVPERVHQLIIENFGVGSGALEDSDEGYVAPEAQQDAEAEVDEDAAVVRFVTDVITQAVDDQATDIHFEPQEGQLRIRYRVDGLLVPVSVPENLLRFQDAIISRVKIMARLNISERRLPQDGRINFKAGGTTLDIRVSTIPTIYAESISLRLLNKKKEAYTMDRLGMSADEQAQIKLVLDYPHGIILVTGPTGSGKSTSLNAFLRQINSTDLRIITIEDPIEYEVPGVNQMQVRAEIGLTFASALRHVLRQDPDVIMVGEIRDRETADIAIRASLTGHLVFSTLHTNDAPGRHHPPGRHGDRALPRRLGDRARDRPAPGPPALPGVQPPGAGDEDQAPGIAGNPRLQPHRGRLGHLAPLARRLRPLPRHRLPRPDRPLRDLPPERGDAFPRPQAREHPDAGGQRPRARHAHARPERLGEGQGRPHHPGRGPARHHGRREVAAGIRNPPCPASPTKPATAAGPRRRGVDRRPEPQGRPPAPLRPRPRGRLRLRAEPPLPRRPTPMPPRRPATPAPAESSSAFGPRGPAAPRRADRLPFLESLHDLTSSGLSAGEAVRLLSIRIKEPRQRALCEGLWARLSEGAPLSRAMAAFPQVFDTSTINLIHAGEATGSLNDTLARLIAAPDRAARDAGRPPDGARLPRPDRLDLDRRHPLLPLLPPAAAPDPDPFAGGKMPLSTRLLIGMANFALHYGLFVGIAIVVAAIAAWRWRATEAGREKSDAWLLKLPMVGPFVISQTVLEFSQTLGILLQNGITASDALRMTSRQIANRVHRRAFDGAIERVLEGEALSLALTRTGCFPELVLDRISVGENTGNVVPSLRDIGASYQKRITRQLNLFTQVIAGAILGCVFVFVGFVAIAMVMAIFQVSQSFSKAG